MKHFLNVLRRLPLLFTNYFIQLVPLQPMPWPQWCYVFVFSIHLCVCACRDILQLACHRLYFILYFATVKSSLYYFVAVHWARSSGPKAVFLISKDSHVEQLEEECLLMQVAGLENSQ